MQAKLGKVLQRYGVRLSKGPRGRVSAQGVLGGGAEGAVRRNIDDSTPVVVKEAAERMHIRRTYSPLQAPPLPPYCCPYPCPYRTLPLMTTSSSAGLRRARPRQLRRGPRGRRRRHGRHARVAADPADPALPALMRQGRGGRVQFVPE